MAAPHRSAVRALLLMVGQHTVGRGAEWHTSRPRMGATAEKVSRIIAGLLILVAPIVVAGCGNSGPSHPAAVTTSMTGQHWSVWHSLTATQKQELATDCAAQYHGAVPSKIRTGISTPELATRMTTVFREHGDSESLETIQETCTTAIEAIAQPIEEADVERGHKEEEAGEARKEHEKEALKASVAHGTFTATPVSIRRYIKEEQIGQSVRSVTCSPQSCTVQINEYNPDPSGIIQKIVGGEHTAEGEVLESQAKVFHALFADHRVQEAAVESWLELSTVGGKTVKWPAVRTSCTRDAANQIDWERVEPTGIEQLCSVKLLPQGTP